MSDDALKKALKKERKHSAGEVFVLAKYIDLKSDLIYLKLKFWHSEELKSEKIFLRSNVYKNPNALIDCGANCNDFKDLIENIYNQESQLKMQYIHTGLGWTKFNNESIFQYFNALPVKSNYFGNLDIKPKGTFEGWKQTVEKYAMPQVELQLAIILGLSAVTTGILKDELDGSLLIHLYGESSKGKTTFAMLAVSTAGNPNPTSNNTLMCDWADTANFKISMLSNNYGFPLVFDELSKSTQKNLSEFCYNVANGRDKGRLSSSAERKDVQTWSTTVISTGENSLLANCNNNSGLLVRVLELSFDSITKSAQQAEQLKSGLLENYGFANIIFAKYLLQNKELLKENFEYWREVILGELKINSNLLVRLSKRLAVIMLTADFAKTALELDFNLEKIKSVLISSVMKQNESNPFETTDKLIDCLLEDIATHPEYYQRYKTGFPNDDFNHFRKAIIKPIKPIKISDNEECTKEINYFPNEFEKLLKNAGFTDINLCLNKLKSKNYLLTEKGHNTVKRTVDGKQIRVYSLRLPNSKLS